jgi:HlyD family secretion protein
MDFMKVSHLQYAATLIILLSLFSCGRSSSAYQGYIEGRYTYISSYSSGYLQNLWVSRGNRVQEKQKLFNLNPYPEQAQLTQALAQFRATEQSLQNLIQGQRSTIVTAFDAQLKKAKADLALAKITLKRREDLFKQGAIAKAELDDAQTNYQSTQQKVNESNANLDEAKLGSRTHLIEAQRETLKAAGADVERLQWIVNQKSGFSPKNALVYDTFFRVGEFVNPGQPVLALLTPDNVKIVFFVPEPALSQLTLGEKIDFSCDGCRAKSIAKIDFISSQAEYTPPVIYSQNTREKLVFRVEAALEPETALDYHPGQPIRVIVHGK